MVSEISEKLKETAVEVKENIQDNITHYGLLAIAAVGLVLGAINYNNKYEFQLNGAKMHSGVASESQLTKIVCDTLKANSQSEGYFSLVDSCGKDKLTLQQLTAYNKIVSSR